MYWDTEYRILNNFIQPFQKINIKGRAAKDVNKQTRHPKLKKIQAIYSVSIKIKNYIYIKILIGFCFLITV